jgi:hypothetical protein
MFDEDDNLPFGAQPNVESLDDDKERTHELIEEFLRKRVSPTATQVGPRFSAGTRDRARGHQCARGVGSTSP